MKEYIKGKLFKTYLTLLKNDIYLLEVSANERSMTHKLAEYLQQEFPGWNVDCEYNRDGNIPKRVYSTKRAIESDDDKGTTVYPDIIVHHRGTKDNLLIIEAKKGGASGENEDIDKLKAYKEELGYKFAYKIIIPVENAIENIDIEKFIEEVP